MNVKEFDNFVLPIHGGMDSLQETKSRKLQTESDHYILFEEHAMIHHKSKFDQQWKLIRGQSTEWWSLVAEHDLKKVDKAQDKQSKFMTILQVKYGYTREQAREEINKHWAVFYKAQNNIVA